MAAYAVPTALAAAVISESYPNQVPITPTDNLAIGPFMALYVGVAGDVTVIPRNGPLTPVLMKAMPVGTHRIAIQGVNLTGTTATNLVGLG